MSVPGDLSYEVEDVRFRYDRFDRLRDRSKPLDEGDMQNIHQWMQQVTVALEALAACSPSRTEREEG